MLNVQIDVNAQEADLASTETGVSLLQGAFAQGGMIGNFVGSSRVSLSSRSVRVPLLWVAAAAAVAILGMNAYNLKLESEERTIRSQMETNFRSTFPEVTTVADTMVQTKQKLAEVRARAGIASANDFSVLNARTALLLSAAPVGSVAGMEYRDGALKVKFKPSVADNPACRTRCARPRFSRAWRFASKPMVRRASRRRGFRWKRYDSFGPNVYRGSARF